MKRLENGIVFINPYNPDPPPNYFGPPYGISLIAACMISAGIKIPLTAYDFDLEPRDFMLQSVERILRKEKPAYLAIATQSCTRGGVYDLIGLARRIKPDITIILGGPFAAVKYDFLLKSFKVDYVVVGDGEETMVELISKLEEGVVPLGVKGVAFLRKGKIYFSGERDKVLNLDSLPYPAFHLFRGFEKRINSGRSLKPMSNFILGRRCTTLKNALLMLSSRGCVYSCNFCPMSKIDKAKVRFHSPEYFVDMVAYFYRRYGIKDFAFGDNFFTLSRERVMSICDLILKKGLKIKWSCMTRSDSVDKKMLRAMSKAGCFEISYGVESGSEQIQDKIGKKLDLLRTREAFRQTGEVGIRSILMLMVGNTGESESTIRQTFCYVRGLNPDSVLVKRVKVYPGTLIHDLYEKNGLLRKNYYKDSEFTPPSFTCEHSEEELERLSSRLGERRIFVQVNNVCNNNCYPCRLNREVSNKQTAEIKNSLILASTRCEHIVLYGGEIFLRKDVFKLLEFVEQIQVHHLNIYGNARIFSYPKFAERISKYHCLESFIIPFFGLAQIHDDEVKVNGAFNQTMLGIKNLNCASRSFEVKAAIYITESNCAMLGELVKLLVDNKIKSFRFIFMRDSMKLISVPARRLPLISVAAESLKKAAQYLKGKGFEFFFEGFTPCVLKGYPQHISELLSPFNEAITYAKGLQGCGEMRTQDKRKLKCCPGCKEDLLCEGVWRSYLKERGEAEFAPIK
ncbi:MAG: radical SAM protein [Candidatus Omnitrophota bacterium]|jgi:radical SAM superfamily enzyme YgiQ (UPF0313 family)